MSEKKLISPQKIYPLSKIEYVDPEQLKKTVEYVKKEKNTFSLHTDKIYKPCEVLAVLDKAIKESYLKGNNKGIYYYNVPCSFDIETRTESIVYSQ